MKTVNNIQEAIPVLIQAVVTSDLVLANTLLDRFPQLIGIRDKQDRNLLMMACYYSNPNMVSYLVSFHVITTQNIDPTVLDKDELSAYDWAVLSGNEFARSLLLKLVDGEEHP